MCKEIFISTLAISQQKVNGAINGDKENTGITLAVVKPRNPRPAKGFKWMDDDITFLDEFFEKVPKAPSHYCRRDTTKTYLSVIFPTLIKLYDVYKARCQAFKKTAFSLSKFSDVFKGKSLSLYKRKKDKCNTCTGHDEGNISNEAVLVHQKLKDEGFALKEKDKCSADSISKFVLTADTESLLQAPLNNSDIMFFRSKLNLHNFTFYDLKSRKVVNYLWSEVNGLIEAANFTSCYIDYMTVLKCYIDYMTVLKCYIDYMTVLKCYIDYMTVLKYYIDYMTVLKCYIDYMTVLKCYIDYMTVLKCYIDYMTVLKCYIDYMTVL